MYINESIKKYLDELGARQPTPGGGSAAALAGALGAALLEMVCNFTIGNKKYSNVEQDVIGYLSSVTKIREEFMALVDEDAKVYSAINAAFKTKDEKTIDNALKDGYHISLKICRLSRSCAEIAINLSEKGNTNLISDVGCAAELVKASFSSGIFNCEINLKSIKENLFAEKERMVLKALKKDMDELCKKALTKTQERML
ncbi:MAG: cyclodeaminase/cyclohydrolase family protein [Candidatus Omnitrophota bacterium]|nr:cyclodeaminase/cyclohydrolase family protein [Candidatus Omnitrophota bacterium]